MEAQLRRDPFVPTQSPEGWLNGSWVKFAERLAAGNLATLTSPQHRGRGRCSTLLSRSLAMAADEIRGLWKLEGGEGQRLVLTEIKAGDKIGKDNVSLRIYKTAPTVVRIGEPQFVFGVGR